MLRYELLTADSRIVAQAVVFPDGHTVARWFGSQRHTTIRDTPAGIAWIHGLTEPGTGPRRFELHRYTDVSGVSGEGVVASGAVWADGVVLIRWNGDRPSTVEWRSLDDAIAVHGHGGATRIAWIDGDED
jgi:hypothetical protein